MLNNRMNIDDIDLKIILNFYRLKENKPITTYDMVKKIFDINNLNTNERILKNNFLKKRLRRLSEYGVIEFKKDTKLDKYYFDLIAEKVDLRKARIKKLNIDCQAMYVNINNTWNMFIRDFLQ